MSSYNKGIICKEWARNPGPRRGMANYPWFVDAKGEEIIISERDGHRLQLFDSLGQESRFNPFGRRGSGINEFINPGGVTTTDIPTTELVVADSGNKRITLFERGCNIYGYETFQQSYSFGSQGMFSYPLSVEYCARKRLLAVSDYDKGVVTLHSLQGGSVVHAGKLKTSRKIFLINPVDIAFDGLGYSYVTDVGTYCVTIFERDRHAVCTFGKGVLSKPWGICLDRSQNVIVADEGNDKIFMFDRQGKFVKEIVSNIKKPKGVAVTIRGQLAVTTGDQYNFLKLINY